MTDQKQTFWWWVNWSVAPLGIFGGTLALANLGSALIEWNGPIGYLVNWWDVNIANPFGNVINFVIGFICLPPAPQFVIDYIVMALIMITNIYRADSLTDFALTLSQLPKSAMKIQTALILAIALGIIWPWTIIAYPINAILYLNYLDRIRALLIFLPFALFLLIWLINFTFA